MAAEPEKPLPWWRNNKLYGLTPVSGFGLINASNNRYEAIFWYAIIVLFSIFTFRNVLLLVLEYQEGETVTKTEFHSSDSASLNLTTGLFCLRVQLPELNPEYQPFGQFELAKNYITPLEYEVSDALFYLTDKRTIESSPWGYVLLPLLARYFSALQLAQNGIIQNQENIYHEATPWLTLPYLVKNSSFSVIRDQIHRVLEQFRSANVTDGETLQIFGRQVAQLFSFSSEPLPTRLAIMKQAYTFHFQGQYFCYEVPPGTIVKRHMYLAANVNSLYFLLSMTYGLGTTDQIRSWYSQFEPQVMLALRKFQTPDLGAKLGENNEFNLKISSQFQGLNCSSSQYNSDCIKHCFVSHHERTCNCSPAFVGVYPKQFSKPTCTLEDYSSCERDRGECHSTCLPDCRAQYYDLHPFRAENVLEQSMGAFDKRDLMMARVMIVDSHYPVFIEKSTKSFPSFLAELGGSFDLWLSASAIGVLHLLVFAVKQCLYTFNSKTKSGRTMRKFLHHFNRISSHLSAETSIRQTEKIYATLRDCEQLKTALSDALKNIEEDRKNSKSTENEIRTAVAHIVSRIESLESSLSQ